MRYSPLTNRLKPYNLPFHVPVLMPALLLLLLPLQLNAAADQQRSSAQAATCSHAAYLGSTQAQARKRKTLPVTSTSNCQP
jgi:hypothetical protein